MYTYSTWKSEEDKCVYKFKHKPNYTDTFEDLSACYQVDVFTWTALDIMTKGLTNRHGMRQSTTTLSTLDATLYWVLVQWDTTIIESSSTNHTRATPASTLIPILSSQGILQQLKWRGDRNRSHTWSFGWSWSPSMHQVAPYVLNTYDTEYNSLSRLLSMPVPGPTKKSSRGCRIILPQPLGRWAKRTILAKSATARPAKEERIFIPLTEC